MSKAGRNWMFSGVLVVAAAVLVTSVVVGVGLWVHPPSLAAAITKEPQGIAWHGITNPQYFVLSPLTIEARVQRAAAPPPWRTSERAGPFPRLGDDFGQSANVDVRNPGARIDKASTGEGTERRVSRLSRRRLPPESPGYLASKNLESDTASHGLLGANSLSSEINARRPEIGRCAGQRSVAGGKVPPPAGKLALRWVVRTDGSSNDLEVKENTLGNARFSKCVVDTVGRWKFSPPSGGDAPVESTFVFLSS